MSEEFKSREVKTSISIELQEMGEGGSGFEEEFESLSEIDDDPIGHWLRLAKARGETRDSDMLVVNLIVELYRKDDEVSRLIKQEEGVLIELDSVAKIIALGHRIFSIEGELFREGAEYYARINMPVFPRRTIPLFFTAIDPSKGRIIKIHERDEKDMDGYIVARERSLIREQREKKWD